MTAFADQPAVSLPLPKLAAAVIGAVVASTLLGVAASWLASPEAVKAVVMASGAVLFGVGVGLVPLAAAGPRQVITLSMIWIVSSAVRLAAGVSAGVWLYLLLSPDQNAFWGMMLFGLAAALAADALCVIPVMRAGDRPAASETNGCR